MRKSMLVLLACLLALSISCAKDKSEEAGKTEDRTEQHSKVFLVDPVDNQPVDLAASKWSYVYKDVKYNFNSENNMKDFKADPEKYLEKLGN